MQSSAIGRVRSNPRFAELERKRNVLSWTLTAIMLVIYGAFIYLVAFMPWVMTIRLGEGVMTLGFPLGVAVIVSAIALTGLYVWRANTEFDRLTRAVQEGQR